MLMISTALAPSPLFSLTPSPLPSHKPPAAKALVVSASAGSLGRSTPPWQLKNWSPLSSREFRDDVVARADVSCRQGVSPRESPLGAAGRGSVVSVEPRELPSVVGREPSAGQGEVLIELKNVYKSFGDKHILKNASLQIRDGEAIGIIGPSGTGKSTVLKVMAGLLAPDKGEVWVAGKKREGLLDDGDDCGLKIGLVFQSAALFDSLTVRENVGFLLYEHSNLSEEVIRARVRDSLAAVGLRGVEERMPAELSGGMRKRVALARAIISESSEPHEEREVVMYDEPTAGLDPIASTVVEDLIRSVHKSTASGTMDVGQIASYIVVTHQHSTIRRAVDRLLFLFDGKVQWEGTTAEFDTTDNPLVRQFAEGSLKGPISYF